MIGHVGLHRPDHADVVDALAHMREDLADLDPALAVGLELEGRAERSACLPLGTQVAHRQGLAVVLRQLGLGVERVDLRRSAVHEQVDHPLGLGGELRQREAPSGWRPSPARAACRLLPRQQRPKRQRAETHARADAAGPCGSGTGLPGEARDGSSRASSRIGGKAGVSATSLWSGPWASVDVGELVGRAAEPGRIATRGLELESSCRLAHACWRGRFQELAPELELHPARGLDRRGAGRAG